jgi:hypothetical protein
MGVECDNLEENTQAAVVTGSWQYSDGGKSKCVMRGPYLGTPYTMGTKKPILR